MTVGPTMIPALEVRAWGHTVGAITLDNTGIVEFEYAEDWVTRRIDLAPRHLPVTTGRQPTFRFPDLPRATFRGLPGMLSDSLPDNFGNSVINAWLESHNIDKNSFTVLDRLAYIGERGFGALTYHPATPIDTDTTSSVLDIAALVTAARSAIKGTVDNTETLSHLIRVGSSAGGARAKAIINYNTETGELTEGHLEPEPGFEPWLMKLDGVNPNASVLGHTEPYTRIEYAYHLMAMDAGIIMNPCELIDEGPRAHFITKRFDRTRTNDRVHMQTLCALDHLDFRQPAAHSYEQLLRLTSDLNPDPYQRGEAYRRLVFNVLAVNRDDHTKNTSFLYTPDDGWHLSPAYDVTYAHNPDGLWTATHQMTINKKTATITRDDLHYVGDKYGIPGYRDIIKTVTAAVADWETYAQQAGVPESVTKRIRDDLNTVRLS